MCKAVNLIYDLQSRLLKYRYQWSDIYIMAMSSKLLESEILQELLASLRKASSKLLQTVYNTITATKAFSPFLSDHIGALEHKLSHVTNSGKDELKSGHHLQNSNLRTTVIAQKVELSQQASRMTQQETKYTTIIDSTHTLLQEYLTETLIDPRLVFPVEVLLYDLPSPYRDTFTPRPRYTIERALSRPHDYLGTEHSGGIDEATQPAISTLYEMYLACGSLFNASDLWSAFSTVLAPEPEVVPSEQERTLSLFERALADLKYLGILKQTRKKSDHLSKLAWVGL